MGMVKEVFVATLTEVIETQCAHLRAIGKRIDERGYCVILHGVNREGENPKLPHGMVSFTANRMVRQWAKAGRRKVAVVNVWVSPHDKGRVNGGMNPFDCKLSFECTIPRSRHLRPLVAVLEMSSTAQSGRSGATTGVGFLHRTELSDRFEFKGEGREALEGVLRVLEMSCHREMLLRWKEEK